MTLASFLTATAATPHPHSGVLRPVKLDGPGIILDDVANGVLSSGKPYHSKDGWFVQDMNAPTDIVWANILDYERYKDKIPNILESQVYKKEQGTDGSQHHFVRMVAGHPCYKLNFFLKFTHCPQANALIWTLDYSLKSDVHDDVGGWFVLPHPDDPENKSRAFYKQNLLLFSWVPNFIRRRIEKSSSSDSIRHIKMHSECALN